MRGVRVQILCGQKMRLNAETQRRRDRRDGGEKKTGKEKAGFERRDAEYAERARRKAGGSGSQKTK